MIGFLLATIRSSLADPTSGGEEQTSICNQFMSEVIEKFPVAFLWNHGRRCIAFHCRYP